MGTSRFTPEFKEEAVRQITERDRLDVSAHSLYKWLRVATRHPFHLAHNNCKSTSSYRQADCQHTVA